VQKKVFTKIEDVRAELGEITRKLGIDLEKIAMELAIRASNIF